MYTITDNNKVLIRKSIITIFMILIIGIFIIFNNVDKAYSYSEGAELQESFETGTFTGTNFIANSGVITNDPNKVISGSYSAYLESTGDVYSEFSYTDASKVKFEKNTTYTITFKYKVVTAPSQANNGAFYFLARSTNSTYNANEDRAWTTWTGPSGTSGMKTIAFTTGNEDNYFLIWGIYNSGALSIDDISITKKSESFEKGTFSGTNFKANSAVITNDPSKVISKSYSAYSESTESGYSELLYTDASKVKFEKNTTYRVTFKYKVITAPLQSNNGTFYFLARSTNPIYHPNEDRGWTPWTGPSGSSGMRTVEFTTGNEDNYFLIWGIYNGGALSIDDIYIDKIKESFEEGSFTNTNFLANAGEITNDPSKVINGSYSAHLSSNSTGYAEFSYSDPSKLQFKKNTTYTISFSYKSIVESSNGYFYFLARSTNSIFNPNEDRGWTNWTAPSGSTGTKTIEFKTGNEDNYFLIWGIYNKGALSIDDIQITENQYQYDSNGRLTKQILPNNQEIIYSYDLNGNLIKRMIR